MKVILAIVLLTVVYLFGMSKLDNIRKKDLLEINSSSEVITSKEDTTSSEEEVETIKIEISGAVNKKGTYTLNSYSLLSELLTKAGGIKDNADSDCYDESYVLDGSITSIYIPATSENNKVSINDASLSELTSLTGIGKTTAQKIIDYRDEHGEYKSIDELRNVSGIGNAKFEDIRDYIKLHD